MPPRAGGSWWARSCGRTGSRTTPSVGGVTRPRVGGSVVRRMVREGPATSSRRTVEPSNRRSAVPGARNWSRELPARCCTWRTPAPASRRTIASGSSIPPPPPTPPVSGRDWAWPWCNVPYTRPAASSGWKPRGRAGRRSRCSCRPQGVEMRVLVVDDDLGLRQSLTLLLQQAGYQVTADGSPTRALDQARSEAFDIILCDVRMPEMEGLEFLRRYREGKGAALVIMMSAYGGEDAAIAAMKEGAYDYLPKPFRPDEVVLKLRKAEERERLREEVAGLRAQLATGPTERGLVVESGAMRQALALVARVAEHNTTVLITGESGTGKEV